MGTGEGAGDLRRAECVWMQAACFGCSHWVLWRQVRVTSGNVWVRRGQLEEVFGCYPWDLNVIHQELRVLGVIRIQRELNEPTHIWFITLIPYSKVYKTPSQEP